MSFSRGAKRHDKSIVINVVSFGFKYGVPPESDLVFDVRFLPNPYYETELRTKTGRQKPVRDYVLKWRITGEFLELLYKLIDFLIPQYIEEGKTSLAISIGCTGGKHRSVVLAEEIRAYIERRGYKSAVFQDCGRNKNLRGKHEQSITPGWDNRRNRCYRRRTGLSSCAGLETHYRIAAVVAVSDDGGGSETQRMGILPRGTRNCIMALSNTDRLCQAS